VKPLRIMIVDDSLLAVKKVAAILRDLGHEVVHTCKSGTEAVSDYPEAGPDLVTMDITMPDMDGIEATRRIIACDPNALVVMVTSHGQEQMVMDAIEAGAKGYVLKPFQKEKFADAIDKVVKKYRSD
jgi:two-component system chemotaxis response regulator CheY